ncbi:unnamed protein product [Rotaria sordida]|uniref:Uncharacterized protein n=1 Tax=Rotaria sordida TaxID=392033 RepID=A0A813VP99_9BILA|nr:unnamed protein product [Rotaria sordida]CAF0846195.1 unnamed protein product [Rotaria sordida]
MPEIGYNIDEVNYVLHHDPDLFSLSILPTCDSLQLKDQRENKSIDEPNNSQPEQSNIDVIWLGEEASIFLPEIVLNLAVDQWADDNYPKVKSVTKIETNKDLQIQELIAQNCDRQLDYHDEMRRMHSANGVTPLAAAHAREERQCIEVKLGDLSQRLPYAQKCKLEHQVAEEKCARIERNLERQMKDLIRRREALQLQEEDILEGSFSVQSTN